MAFDTYMNIAGLPGESTAAGAEKQIEIFSWSWGASNPSTIGPGKSGISAGRVSVSSFNVMKKTDKTSPTLFAKCCAGKDFDTITVTMRKAAGDAGQKPFLIYTFTSCMVESIQWSGSSGGDDTPTESVSLAFAKVAIEYYMKITGPNVDGESTAKEMDKYIEIYSFSWGASNPTTVGPGSGGLAAGRASVSSFNIMKRTETSSANLFAACVGGQHYKKAEVYLRKATGVDGGQKVFLKYTFEDVMVESIQWSGSSGGDDTPTESVSMAFAKVSIEYYKQAEDTGSMTKVGNATWDLTKVSK